ncbi:hypothetical protein K432DRAFT_131268 [Lepidopterella palustris CBS 459.81]|uniref:Uncharacterized protein n=1 Tax=Lepidopterella palustris CBS 459.81 TaxID=1314670 RepID=A0A8E2EI95_9PEZI|nr:hypothetical protein K432DRAFT_131268 [Lepidopterella palustris CBS 459.81]
MLRARAHTHLPPSHPPMTLLSGHFPPPPQFPYPCQTDPSTTPSPHRANLNPCSWGSWVGKFLSAMAESRCGCLIGECKDCGRSG